MRIGMVLMGVDFPPDIRVAKEAGSLTEAGHEVALLCSALKGRPARSTEDGLEVARIPSRPDGLAKLANSAVFYATLRVPHVARALRVWAREHGINVLHVHDLPMAPTVLAVGRQLGVPVVVDLHENYPALLREWRRPSRNQRLFRVYERYAAIEAAVAEAADRLIVVVPEAAERFRQAVLPKDRIAVVSNTEPLSYGDAVMRIGRDPCYGDDIVLSYAGGFASHRGLESVIGAMPTLLASGRPYRLVLAGDGPSDGELRRLASSLELGERVQFTGWLDAESVQRLIGSSDLCLVPHLKSEHTETTVPHKLFQYMVSGRAVAVADCAPLRRIVEQSGCGVVVRDASPERWAAALAEVSDRKKAAALGAAGREACEKKYRWELDGEVLVTMYEGLEHDDTKRTF